MELLDDKYCFVCGINNPIGLKLDFRLEGDTLKTNFTPQKIHQGYAGIVHGGVIGLVLDEMLVNLPWKLGMKVVTAEFTVRLKKPVLVGEELFFSSRILEDKGKIVVVEAEAKKSDGVLAAYALGKCVKI